MWAERHHTHLSLIAVPLQPQKAVALAKLQTQVPFGQKAQLLVHTSLNLGLVGLITPFPNWVALHVPSPSHVSFSNQVSCL